MIARCYHRCKKCGIVPYDNYVSGLGLTLSQQKAYFLRRENCKKCGGTAKPLNIEEIRKHGLDGGAEYVKTDVAVLMDKDRQ